MLLEALIGISAIALLARKQSKDAATPPDAKNPLADEAFDNVGDQLAAVINEPGNAARNTSTAISSAFNQFMGSGGGYGFTAVAVNAGVAVDKAIGGDGSGAGAVVASTTLAILPAVMYYCMAAVPALLFIAAFVMVVIESVTYAVAEGKQAEGLRNLEAKWSTVHTQVMTALKAQFPNKNVAALERVAVPFVDGFIQQSNRIAYLKAWHGTNIRPGNATDGYHPVWFIAFGRIIHAFRSGLFVGTFAPTPNGYDQYDPRDPTKYGNTPWEPSQWFDGKSLRVVSSFPEAIFDVTGFYSPETKVGGGFIPHSERPEHVNAFVPANRRGTKTILPAFAGSTIKVPLLNMTIPLAPRPAVTRQYDLDAEPYVAAGRFFSNAAHYVAFMSSPWGLGQNEGSTLAWGLGGGEFEGTMSPGPFRFQADEGGQLPVIAGNDGHLVFQGRDVYWRDSHQRPGISPKFLGDR